MNKGSYKLRFLPLFKDDLNESVKNLPLIVLFSGRFLNAFLHAYQVDRGDAHQGPLRGPDVRPPDSLAVPPCPLGVC